MSLYENQPTQPQNPYPVKPPPTSGMSAGKIILIVLSVLLFVLAVIVMALLLWPVVTQVRDAAHRKDSANRARHIVISMHNYHDSYRRLPPAFTTDETGKRLHSWRTQLLPFMEKNQYFDQIDMQKPWNDPVNQSVISQNINDFESLRCNDSLGSNLTAYVAVVDTNTAMREGRMTLEAISDGASSTGLILEIPKSDIQWAEPRDITIAEAIDFIKNHNLPGGLNVGFADGSVRAIDSNVPEDTIRKIFDCRDGEVLPMNF